MLTVRPGIIPVLFGPSLTLNNAVFSVDGDGSSDYNYYDESPPNLRAPIFVLFASCWTILFALYLFITSTTAYTPTDRPVGKFFNQTISFAADCLSVVFWFAGFISLAQFNQAIGSCSYVGNGVCGTVITSILMGVCLWYSHCSRLTLR